jgi:hypothetical protein
MREIKEERFKKKEDIEFHPVAIPEPLEPQAAARPVIPQRTDESSFERTNERTETKPAIGLSPATTYLVTIPKERRKTRQSFDIFEDQYDALKKLQLAEAELLQSKTGRKLGDLVQESLDRFIQEKAERLGNITVVRE